MIHREFDHRSKFYSALYYQPVWKAVLQWRSDKYRSIAAAFGKCGGASVQEERQGSSSVPVRLCITNRWRIHVISQE